LARARRDSIADRHALDAAEEARAQPLDRAGQLDRIDAFDEVARSEERRVRERVYRLV
jgi:hypothetical protein